MSRNKEHRPNGAAAFGGRPIGGAAEVSASVFFVSAHSFIDIYMDIPYIFMDIPYIILLHFIFIGPNYFPYIFLCMFLNLFSQYP